MRAALFLVSALVPLLAGAPAQAASFKDVAQVVNDDQKLIFAGLSPEKVTVRKQCSAAVLETDDRPESFECVYVQTENDVNLLSLEDGYLIPELQAKLNVMDGVALARTGRWSQVQVFTNGRVAAFYIYGENWIDTEQTEAVYAWLIAQGVPKRAPRKWIGR
jgi:hypothetical protein